MEVDGQLYYNDGITSCFHTPYHSLIVDQSQDVFSNLEVTIPGKLFLQVPTDARTVITIPWHYNIVLKWVRQATIITSFIPNNERSDEVSNKNGDDGHNQVHDGQFGQLLTEHGLPT